MRMWRGALCKIMMELKNDVNFSRLVDLTTGENLYDCINKLQEF